MAPFDLFTATPTSIPTSSPPTLQATTLILDTAEATTTGTQNEGEVGGTVNATNNVVDEDTKYDDDADNGWQTILIIGGCMIFYLCLIGIFLLFIHNKEADLKQPAGQSGIEIEGLNDNEDIVQTINKTNAGDDEFVVVDNAEKVDHTMGATLGGLDNDDDEFEVIGLDEKTSGENMEPNKEQSEGVIADNGVGTKYI